MNEPKNSLIIGNGFDIDLSLNTRFSDFANAKDFWPENDGSKLSAYLESKKSVEKWFNLEGALREYAMSVSGEFGMGPRTNSEGDAADFAYFEKMRLGLMDYLTEEEKKNIKSESVAAQVLHAIQNNLLFEHIYTLNYTDLNVIGRRLGINNLNNVCYLHGSLANKDIIIGIDDVKIKNNFKNWRKTRSEFYKSHNIFADLDASKEIVFFGLSFGWIDYKYFNQFFAKMSTPTVEPIMERDKKYITIFTYDENDRRSIYDFLERMDVDLDYLYSQTHFDIIRTKDNQDSKKVEAFLTRLRNSRPFIPHPKVLL